MVLYQSFCSSAFPVDSHMLQRWQQQKFRFPIPLFPGYKVDQSHTLGCSSPVFAAVWEAAAGITALLLRLLWILIRAAKKFLPRALPAAASTEFYSGIITDCLMHTFMAGVKNGFLISSIFSQVLQASGDDTAGELQKEPWKPDASSLLLLPLGMVRPRWICVLRELLPQGKHGRCLAGCRGSWFLIAAHPPVALCELLHTRDTAV